MSAIPAEVVFQNKFYRIVRIEKKNPSDATEYVLEKFVGLDALGSEKWFNLYPDEEKSSDLHHKLVRYLGEVADQLRSEKAAKGITGPIQL